MNYRRAQRLAILGDTSPDSQALAKNAIRLIDQTSASREPADDAVAGRRDLDIEAKAAVASHPDFVFWTGSAASGGALVKALRDAGFKGTFTASAASESPAFLAAAGRTEPRAHSSPPPRRRTNTCRTRRRGAGASRRRIAARPGSMPCRRTTPYARSRRRRARPDDTDGAQVAHNLPKLSEKLTTFLGVVRFARDHTLLYDNRVILVVKNGDFAWERSLRTDSLQG